MINLFFVINDYSGARTYASELFNYLQTIDEVNLFLVHFANSNYKEFTVIESEGMTNVFIPNPLMDSAIEEKYYKQSALLVHMYFGKLKNVLFHFNMFEHFYFAKVIKDLFFCPVVFTVHFLPVYYSYIESANLHSSKVDRKGLLQYILNLADKVICVTKFAKRLICKIEAVDSKKLIVIYNGLKVKNNIQADIPKEQIKNNLGLNQHDKHILFAGRLNDDKGLDILIKAFKQIKGTYPEVKLLIAGKGEYDKYFSMVQDFPGRVCFTGNLPKEKLMLLYQIAEIGVIPSKYEQCSYVALEMMRQKLPVVISDVPGLNELYEHGERALFCKTFLDDKEQTLEVDSVDLAKQISMLLINKQFAVQIAKNAYDYFCIEHSQRSMGKKTLDVYKQLAKHQN